MRQELVCGPILTTALAFAAVFGQDVLLSHKVPFGPVATLAAGFFCPLGEWGL
jgi:hypothetical protein